MRFTKKAVWATIVTTLVLGLVVTVGIGIGIVKLWPVAWTWAQNALGASDFDAARRAVAQLGVWLGDDRIVQLSRTGEAMAGMGALTGSRELAEVVKWTAAIPALGPLVQNGGYQRALEEAVRQNVPNIGQIRLDQVASPEVRAVLAEVQQAVAKSPQVAEAASTVNANVLNLLKSDAFARLSQDPGFSRFLSGSAPTERPSKEAE